MKKLFLPILILFSTIANAQDVIKGTLNTATKIYSPKILAEDDNNIYGIGYYNGSSYAEAFDKKSNQKLSYSTEIVNFKTNDGYKTSIERVRYINNQFYIFYSYYNKEKSTYNLIVKTINSNTGKLSDKITKLFDVEVENKRRSGDFDVTISKDNSKIFIYHGCYSKEKKVFVRRYYLLNSDLQIEYKHELDPNERLPSNYIIDNDGSIYSLKEKKDGLYIAILDANKEYELWEEKLKINFEKEFENYRIDRVFLKATSNGSFLVTGLFSEKEIHTETNKKGETKVKEDNFYRLKGAFYFLLDAESKEMLHSNSEYFSQEFIDQFKREKDEESGKDVAVIDNFSIGDIYEKRDGGYVIVLESYFNIENRDSDGRLTGEYYLFGDIVTINFSEVGKIIWANRLPKKQIYYWFQITGAVYATSRGPKAFIVTNDYSTRRHFSTCAYLSDNKINIYFNDILENIENKEVKYEPKKLKKLDKAVVCKYEIDLETGNANKSVDYELMKTGTVLSPWYSGKIPNSENVVFFGIDGSGYTISRSNN